MTAATTTRTRKPAKPTPAQLPMIPQTSAAYEALLQESEAQQLPQHYKTDLTEIDREILLKDDAPAVFGWQLRECGTGLYRADVMSLMMAEAARDVYPQSLWYVYDDAGLTQVKDADRMIACLVSILDVDVLLAALVTATDARFTADNKARAFGDADHYRAAGEARQAQQRAQQHYEWAQIAKSKYSRS